MNIIFEKVFDNIFEELLQEAILEQQPKVVEIQRRPQDVLLTNFVNNDVVSERHWLPLIDLNFNDYPIKEKYAGYSTYRKDPPPPTKKRTEAEVRILKSLKKDFVWVPHPDYDTYQKLCDQLRANGAEWWEFPFFEGDERTNWEQTLYEEFVWYGKLSEDEWHDLWDHATSNYAMEQW